MKKDKITAKEMAYIKIALESLLDSFVFIRGFGEETDKEKFIKKLITKLTKSI